MKVSEEGIVDCRKPRNSPDSNRRPPSSSYLASWLIFSSFQRTKKRAKNEFHSPVTPESMGPTVNVEQENRPVNFLNVERPFFA